MKKWLSLLLSLVCLFSFSAVATAEDADFLSQGALGQAGLFPIVCNLTSQLLNYF